MRPRQEPDQLHLHAKSAAAVKDRSAFTPGVDFEVYLARRASHLGFMGGFHVFPGGTVDHTVDHLTPIQGACVQPLGCAAAVRELFEETGVLSLQHRDGTPVSIPQDERAALRHALLKDPQEWLALIKAHDAVIDSTLYVPLGAWQTPAFFPVRFDATYFGLWLPHGEAPDIWPGELDEGAWFTPEEAIAQHSRGELFIAYPVLETLRLLVMTHGQIAEASRHAVARGPDAHRFVGGEMVSGVHMVPLRTPTLPPATHTNCYVLGHQELVIVDPATPYEEEQARLLEYLAHLQAQGRVLKEIWLTHQHIDHIGAVEWLRQTLNIPVAAHPLTARELQGRIAIDRLIHDGDVASLGCNAGPAAQWIALHTPGHAYGHLCFFEQRLGILLSGDNVVGIGTVLIAPPEGDMIAYMASLQRMNALPIRMMFPAHGPPMAAAHEKIAMYIAHRTMREESIVSALAGTRDALTARQIVALVYDGLDTKLYPLAELNVRAHLQKLVNEGRINEQSDGQHALFSVSPQTGQ